MDEIESSTQQGEAQRTRFANSIKRLAEDYSRDKNARALGRVVQNARDLVKAKRAGGEIGHKPKIVPVLAGR